MKKVIIVLCCLLVFHYYKANAQDFSNQGRVFWFIYTAHVDSTASGMAVYLTSNKNALGSVDVIGSYPFTVTANNVTTVQFTNTSPVKFTQTATRALPIAKNYNIVFRASSGKTCVNELKKTITVNGTPDVTFSVEQDICFNGRQDK